MGTGFRIESGMTNKFRRVAKRCPLFLCSKCGIVKSMNTKITPQERQNRIYRKMSAKKKAEITFSFYRLGKYLSELKNGKTSRTKKLNQNRQNA